MTNEDPRVIASNAYVNAIRQQRDAALNGMADLQARIAMLEAENARLKERTSKQDEAA